MVARLDNPDAERIIGISIGNDSEGINWFDICYLHVPVLDEEFIKLAKDIQEEFGYFKTPKISNSIDFRKP